MRTTNQLRKDIQTYEESGEAQRRQEAGALPACFKCHNLTLPSKITSPKHPRRHTMKLFCLYLIINTSREKTKHCSTNKTCNLDGPSTSSRPSCDLLILVFGFRWHITHIDMNAGSAEKWRTG